MVEKLIGRGFVVAALAAAVGCGGSSPYAMVKVSGKVVYEDGEPIPADSIMIRFDSLEPPKDEKTHPRPGLASAGPDGGFDVVTTNKYADGIVRGRHKVQLSASDSQGKRLIPAAYSSHDSTPIEVDSSESPFEFRVPRL